MKFTRLIIVAVVFVGVGFVAFDYFRPEFPVERTIMNDEGRELVVSIVGRKGDAIFVDRLPDLERFEIDLKTLVPKDRFFCRLLPEASAPAPKVAAVVAPPEDRYIEARKEGIKDLRQKMAGFAKEVASESLPDALSRRRVEQIQEIELEIKELESDIETYRYQQKK